MLSGRNVSDGFRVSRKRKWALNEAIYDGRTAPYTDGGSKGRSLSDAERCISDHCATGTHGTVSGCIRHWTVLGLRPCRWMVDASDTLVDAMLSDVLESGNFQAQFVKCPFADVLTDA